MIDIRRAAFDNACKMPMKKILFDWKKVAPLALAAAFIAAPAFAEDSIYQPYDPDADDSVIVQSGMYGEYDPSDDFVEPEPAVVAAPALVAPTPAARMAKLPTPRLSAAHIHGTPKTKWNVPGTIVASGVFAPAPRLAAKNKKIGKQAVPKIEKPTEKSAPTPGPAGIADSGGPGDSVMPPPKESVNVPIAVGPTGIADSGGRVAAVTAPAAPVKPGSIAPVPVAPAVIIPAPPPAAAPTNNNLDKIIAAQGTKSVSDFCDYSALPARVSAGLPRGFILMPGAPNRMDCKKK